MMGSTGKFQQKTWRITISHISEDGYNGYRVYRFENRTSENL